MEDHEWVEVIRKAIHEGEPEFIHFDDGDIDYAGLAYLIYRRLFDAGIHDGKIY